MARPADSLLSLSPFCVVLLANIKTSELTNEKLLHYLPLLWHYKQQQKEKTDGDGIEEPFGLRANTEGKKFIHIVVE